MRRSHVLNVALDIGARWRAVVLCSVFIGPRLRVNVECEADVYLHRIYDTAYSQIVNTVYFTRVRWSLSCCY